MYSRIRDLREDGDLPQSRVAQAIHCSQQTYSNYENGRRTIPPEVLIRLARFHGTSVDYLLGLTDKKEPYPSKNEESV